jgi:hypothetical protein
VIGHPFAAVVLLAVVGVPAMPSTGPKSCKQDRFIAKSATKDDTGMIDTRAGQAIHNASRGRVGEVLTAQLTVIA